MTDQKPKRLLGRIDRIYTGKRLREGKPWGFLVTEDWKRYQWHSNDLEDQGQVELKHGDIVSFEPTFTGAVLGAPEVAMKLQLVKRESNAEVFGKFARFVRERSEEVA
jgi:hypothetical protein